MLVGDVIRAQMKNPEFKASRELFKRLASQGKIVFDKDGGGYSAVLVWGFEDKQKVPLKVLRVEWLETVWKKQNDLENENG